MRRFSLPGPSVEERQRRWLVPDISTVFEALAFGVVRLALMSMPATPLLKTAKGEVPYFH